MEKQKYLYKNSKCVGATSSTVSLINAWISVTGQRNIQKYRSIAYLGGFTIIAFATIWFLSQSPYTIECKSNDTDKSDKPDKSDKSNKSNKKGDDTGKSDKRSSNANKSSVGLWSSIRDKIVNKLGFGKKSKSQKNAKAGKPSSSRNNNSSGSSKNGKLNGKKRAPKDNGAYGSASSSKTSAKPNGSTGSSNIKNNIRDAKSIKIQETRIESLGDSNTSSRNSSNVTLQPKDQITQEIRVRSYGDSSSSSSNNRRQKDQVTQKIRVESSYGESSNSLRQKVQIAQEIRVESCDSSFTSKSNETNKVKQQPLRKLKLKAQETRSSNWTNRYKLPSRDMENKNKYRLGDCSISKHPEKVNLTSPIRNECLSKSLCQDVDNKESSNRQDHTLTDIEIRIAETIKKINLIDLQVREKYREFYIPYTPLTLRETFDKIGQERVERYKKLLVKLGSQKQQDSNLESTLQMVQEFFHEKKYFESEEDDDCHEKRVDQSNEFDDFLEKLEYIQNKARPKVSSEDDVNCPKFVDVLVQDELASRKRIERNFEILKMIELYQQQGKETEMNIKKSIEMFNEQRAHYKGLTRHLKRPSRFNDEFNRFQDRLMDIEQQTKDLATGLDDMEAYFEETLELFNDNDKMNTAAAKYGPILNDDD